MPVCPGALRIADHLDPWARRLSARGRRGHRVGSAACRKVGWERKARFLIYESCSLDCDRFQKSLEIMSTGLIFLDPLVILSEL